MSNIQCSVMDCAHNRSGGCYAATLNIGGKSAVTSSQTCCGSYLNNRVYGNLADFGASGVQPKIIGCNASKCKHNSSGVCSLNGIVVTNCTVDSIHGETQCDSFE